MHKGTQGEDKWGIWGGEEEVWGSIAGGDWSAGGEEEGVWWGNEDAEGGEGQAWEVEAGDYWVVCED